MFPQQAATEWKKWDVSKYSISSDGSLDESLISSLPGFRSAGEGNMISLECSWNTRQWSDSSHAVSQQNQAVYCWASLSIEKTLSPAPTVFFSTNQSTSKPLISSLPLSLRDAAAGSHSSGMNLSRLEHSAKGHYPGLHVCWAAVLSNSTRCCCDHGVTCEGICISHPSSLLTHLRPPERLSVEITSKIIGQCL